jgi:glycosyltransferase involved in cell wall biosynthesis
MRLLFLVPSFPSPPRAGHELIAYQHIKYLAQRHSVDLLSFDVDDKKLDIEKLYPYCHAIDTVHIQPWRRRFNECLGLATGASLHAAAFKSSKMSDLIWRRVSDNKYDVIIFQTTLMSQYLPQSFQGATVLNMIDPLVVNLERSLVWNPWFIRPWMRFKIMRLKRYELSYAKRFNRVVLVNRADILDYQAFLTGARFDWVPHTVDVGFLVPKQTPRRDGAIVISGIMDHAPNVDAVEYFCRDIFPLVRRELPYATLSIVGSRPTAAVRKWASFGQINVTGSVLDIRPYLNEAMVSVCPVRLRVGTQTKILEAMATGTPVVTTSAGNYGVGGISGEHLYVADNPSEFAKRVVELLRGENWDQFSTKGRRFVCDNFSEERSGAKFESILVEVAREVASQIGADNSNAIFA